jgi:hypothetical protein
MCLSASASVVLVLVGACIDDESFTRSAYATCLNSDGTFDVTITGPEATECANSAGITFPGNPPISEAPSRVSVTTTATGVVVRFRLPAGLRPGENSSFRCTVTTNATNQTEVRAPLPRDTCSAIVNGPDGGPLREGGGGDPDSSTPSGGPREPLGATIDMMVATNFTPRGQAFAKIMAPKTPQEEDRVLKERAFFDNQAGFPTINVGECKLPPYLGVEGEPLPVSNIGPRLTINNGANPYMSMPGNGSYAGASNVVNPYGMKLSVVITPGNADIQEVTFDQILNVPTQFTVTAPPPGPVVTSLNAPVTVSWTPVPSDFFFLRFSQGSGHVCKADPKSGTFTIPTDIMAAQRGAGMPSVDLVALNVGRTTTISVAGTKRAFDTMTSVAHRIDFQVVNP